jgi:hypothetical protein
VCPHAWESCGNTRFCNEHEVSDPKYKEIEMKVLSTLTLMMLLGVACLAYGKSKPLADNQMDQISAGSAVAANNNSLATDTSASAVVLTDGAQSGSSAVNIVNSSNSTVANAGNAWAGNTLMDAGAVAQANAISQQAVPAHNSGEFDNATITAFGDAIAANNSEADNTSTNSVSLSGSAQSTVTANNVVNAAGSVVANALNVASSNNMTTLGMLTQSNVVSQLGH